MSYKFTSHLYIIAPLFRRSLMPNIYSSILRKEFLSKGFCSHFQIKNCDEKYKELKARFDSIPYKRLIDVGKESFRQELCYDKDSRKKDALDWCAKVFDHNTSTCRTAKASLVLKAYCTYGFTMDDTSWNQWDSEGWETAAVLGWCSELISLQIAMADDIMDQSDLRRGVTCWYKKPEVGLTAINDALLMLCGAFKVLKGKYSCLRSYNRLMDEFLQATQEIAYGQCLDMVNASFTKVKDFTWEKYTIQAELKARNVIYSLPIFIGMHINEECRKEEFDSIKEILALLGFYFSANDDYLDCFGSLKFSGMIGNDIREGKNNWFAIKFMETATEPMKKRFQEIYGVKDEDAVSEVLEIYRSSHLKERFYEFEEEMFKKLSSLVESMNDIKGALFYEEFEEIKKRKTY